MQPVLTTALPRILFHIQFPALVTLERPVASLAASSLVSVHSSTKVLPLTHSHFPLVALATAHLKPFYWVVFALVWPSVGLVPRLPSKNLRLDFA